MCIRDSLREDLAHPPAQAGREPAGRPVKRAKTTVALALPLDMVQRLELSWPERQSMQTLKG
eukprot:13839889-Alexandrium_andersonii.AAC.1